MIFCDGALSLVKWVILKKHELTNTCPAYYLPSYYSMKSLAFFLFLLLSWNEVYAGDILFLDINNAISEIKVIQKYMGREKTDDNEPGSAPAIAPLPLLSWNEAHGIDNNISSGIDARKKHTGKEKTDNNGHEPRLVIVPSMETFNMEKRKKLQELSSIMNAYKAKNIKNPSAELSRKIFNLGKIIRWHKTGDTAMEYLLSDFIKELKDVLNNDSFDFDRVFISGHHGTNYGSLTGVLGGEFFNGLIIYTLKALLNNSRTTQNVNSLILFGCQTANNKLMGREGVAWASVLPDSLFQFGFNESAPVKTDTLNLSILGEILEIQTLISHFKNDQDSKISLDMILRQIMKIKRGNRYLGFRLNNKYYQHPKHFVE